ncbi:heat repeat-containing protein [Leptolyngbya sp. Heron Island J]|uniref:DUF4132 domain-containing protein n=1 Tax=Leptolyngbya sp. Heron Island J TaxID=1385935 RepID=UPI0003B99120|nr:DUF4132 domain-containing protein [Leptolyngbya sp. Heron Island J]ESA34519.1 heat repeat-containing protein [Leptolyngbya sp. Heron Island J]
MLKREIAQERLKAFRVDDWAERRSATLAALPDALNQIGQSLLGLNGKQRRDSWQDMAAVSKLSTQDRRQLFLAIFPQIGAYVDAAYELMLQLPYQNGYARRAFRSSQPAHYTDKRSQWLYSLLGITQEYEQPLDWYAAWSPYIGYGADCLGLVFAAAINQDDETGKQVFDILCDSARGDHDIGAMGRHVTRALLVAEQPEGWQLMENMLVAAQRQEGLRQVILETIDEAHPQAFQRMLRVILEQNLVRFSATIRAADVWFGLGWDVDQRRWVQESLEQVLTLLEQSETVALEETEPNRLYLSLWSLAFKDVGQAIKAAQAVFQTGQLEQRFVAAYLLRQLDISESRTALLPSLADDDLRVAGQAFFALSHYSARSDQGDAFEALEAFLQRFLAKETVLKSLVWPWMQATIDRASIADELVRRQQDRPIDCLLPYVAMMGHWGKRQLAEQLAQSQPWDEAMGEVIFGLLRDRSSYVREEMIRQLQLHGYVPSELEAKTMEALMTRKAADLRQGVISLLLKQTDAAVVTSAERLLKTSKLPQRLAGLELLAQLQQAERADVRAIAEQYGEQRSKRTASEQELLDKLLASEQDVPTLNDALGLAPPQQRTKPMCPEMPETPIPLVTDAAQAVLQSLDNLVDQHRATSVPSRWGDPELLGNMHWFPWPEAQLSLEENLQKLPLAEVWQTWLTEQGPQDSLELVRATATLSSGSSYSVGGYRFFDEQPPGWIQGLTQQWSLSTEPLQYPAIVNSVLQWLQLLAPPSQGVARVLNGAQYTLATILERASGAQRYDWRQTSLMTWLSLARSHYQQYSTDWNDQQVKQLWLLLRWVDEPEAASLPRWQQIENAKSYGQQYEQVKEGGFVSRQRPELNEVMGAFRVGAATAADVYDQLLGSQQTVGRYGGHRFAELQRLTKRKGDPLLKTYPQLGEMVEQCRDRILSVELSRGDLPTAATAPALALNSIQGIAVVVKLLQNFGKEKFARGWLWDSQSKSSVFSHLFRVSFPAEADTPKAFTKAVKVAEIPEQRLVELAVYAPQWTRYVEHALGWPDLAEAVWWFHAHTKDNSWQVDGTIRDLWAAQIAELTPLSSQDLVDGAVDVAWFQRIYQRLKAERWAKLNEAAKYASGGAGHKRAQLFAEAMLGETKRTELVKRIQDKRHQDAVRALGLLPLAKGKKRQTDLLERYQMIQEFLRTSRKFGSQRQASEKLASRIGMENLARTAGYPDPQRLEWAMEGVAIADLAAGPVAVAVDEVTVSLSLTVTGEPQIGVIKKGKSLKSIPAKLKKNPDIKALQARKRDITRQARRMRGSLEIAMCRGDEFTGAELKQLLTHPVLNPILQQLVFVDETLATWGYPLDNTLQSYDGSQIALTAKMRLRLAHPVDFARGETWHLWQQYCFDQSLVQPFKQIFRELYVLTTAEQQGRGSRRYAGHQVNPRQALALLGQRGWVTHPEEGVRRTFHDENLLVWIDFEEGWYTPTEVEGFTLDQVCFVDRQHHKPVAVKDVPPRVFSEVMRDLDLVVSVAHQGGVDPEASASTIEMRAALIRETNRLLNITNVELQAAHALIEGQLGNYTIHLGSATVHRQPGGALCIVPVHSQHRGRLFLPFADDDPKTAEVVSKVLLLANDQAIKDPTILEQLL